MSDTYAHSQKLVYSKKKLKKLRKHQVRVKPPELKCYAHLLRHSVDEGRDKEVILCLINFYQLKLNKITE